jgi:hypothetical protein
MTPTATNGQPEASDLAPALDLPLENDAIADRLDEIGHLLAEQEANPFRVRAYREAARTLRGLRRPAVRILEREGTAGLEDLPGIGEALASAIDQLARTGRLGLLDQLRGESSPEAVLATVPGIGKTLAHRLHEELGITTLAELEEAAHDGRLREMEGFGSERIRGVRESLAGRFGPGGRRTPARPPRPHPGVAEILDVDREYRERAAAEDLPRIAPRRFNPTREAWLPILHTKRGPRHYTALYSNTARAHALGKTQDWVVIYQDDHDPHRQWTVVTSGQGPLRGRRVVRGRESECADLYAAPGKD